MKRITASILLVGLFASQLCLAQVDDQYFAPEGTYNERIQTPSQYLGFMTGEWHLTHDQLVGYMKYLASVSDRVTIMETGRTYENRPLLLLTITSPDNHSRLGEIKAEHAKLVDPKQSGSVDISAMPAVVYMGYSIHGNEASGSNAAPWVAYTMAAGTSADVMERLENTVVLLDPSFNPDGMQRFSTWVNSHKSLSSPNADPQDREHDEVWPGGRTNHYWFDLNRDWMPVQHPESQARIRQFHQWFPNVLIDAHEMGTNGTYFFQPGIESRNNPLTPSNTYALTEKIAQYHAKELDAIGSFYYTREGFDDYYLGKGSSYPDVNGSVGILFEQASSRGHVQESVNGELTFAFAIRNHIATSMSTWKAVEGLRQELLSHQREFYKSAMLEARGDEIKAYRVGTSKDPRRSQEFVKMLRQHRIRVYQEANQPAGKYIVPLEQAQYRFIKGLFERRTDFVDSLFYDISAWTMPYAFNLPMEELKARTYSPSILGKEVTDVTDYVGTVHGGRSEYAYTFETHGYFAHRAIYKLQQAGLRLKVATEQFGDGQHQFDFGTIMVPVAHQSLDAAEIFALMQRIAKEDGMDVYAQSTGYTEGLQLGSPSMESLRKPEIAVLSAGGTSSYEVGEVWHLLDYRFGMGVTLLPVENIAWADLDRYNVIVMVSGSYSLSDDQQNKLKDWVRGGGTIIGTRTGARWLSSHGFSGVKYASGPSNSDSPQRPYHMASRYNGAQYIGGSIFHGTIDRTHPLAYGFEGNTISLFRNHTMFMERAQNPYANPVMYTSSPLAAGYISKPNLDALAGTAAAQVSSLGRGRVISFVDDPNFRAFWYGTNKLFLNSIFFGDIISSSTTK